MKRPEILVESCADCGTGAGIRRAMRGLHFVDVGCGVKTTFVGNWISAVARVSEAPPEISRGAPHTLLAYYYELQ